MSDFVVTDEANDKLVEVLKAEENSDELFLRVGVRPGGCSGFSYEMFFDKDADGEDIVITKNGINVRLDPTSASLLKGATLKYDNSLSGGFSIDNPNAQRTCGCGQSFS